jgi:hypothetical protein
MDFFLVDLEVSVVVMVLAVPFILFVAFVVVFVVLVVVVVAGGSSRRRRLGFVLPETF